MNNNKLDWNNKIMKITSRKISKNPLVSKIKAIKILFIIFLLMLQISLVLADSGVYKGNKQFIFDENNTESKLLLKTASMPINNVNLSHAEAKLSANLLEIVSPGKVPWATPDNLENVFRSFVINKKVTSWDSDAVYVTIRIRKGISTHILDSYIHLPVNRIEGWPELSAWVDLPNILKIANLSEVTTISIDPGLLTNAGSVNTEGDLVLHSQGVRSLQNGPNGTGIRIGGYF